LTTTMTTARASAASMPWWSRTSGALMLCAAWTLLAIGAFEGWHAWTSAQGIEDADGIPEQRMEPRLDGPGDPGIVTLTERDVTNDPLAPRGPGKVTSVETLPTRPRRESTAVLPEGSLDAPTYLIVERQAADTVLAAADGTVIFAGQVDGFDRVVILEHANGVTSTYAHLASIAVTDGAAVKRGAAVGVVGPAPGVGDFVLKFEVSNEKGVLAPSSLLGGQNPEDVLFR